MPNNLSASRREILKAGLAVAGAALVPRPALAQTQTHTPLLTRPVPATGIRLPIVGIGTNRFRSGDPAYVARLREQQAAGNIGHIGITTSSSGQYAELEAIMRRERLDFIQVDYAIGNRRAGERLLPLAADCGMAVLVNLPFGRGAQFRAVGGRPLPGWAAEIDCSSWAQVFLKYVLSHPAVTCAIPGSTQVAHVEDNLGAARGRLPDAALRQNIARYFDAIADS